MEIKNSTLSTLDPYRNKLDPNAETVAGAKARAANANADAARTQQAGGGDTVSLSAAARQYTVAHAEANAAPEIRQEKVNGIKERIATGTYSVDAKNIAQKLVENEIDFADALKK